MRYMLTTVDNPHNPWTDFGAWFQYDVAHGYNSCGLLARVAVLSDELSEADESSATQQAIDEIVNENVSGLYRKVPEPAQS